MLAAVLVLSQRANYKRVDILSGFQPEINPLRPDCRRQINFIRAATAVQHQGHTLNQSHLHQVPRPVRAQGVKTGRNQKLAVLV